MPITPVVARRIVAWGRIIYGAACQVVPDAGVRGFMVDPAANPDSALLIRLFGSRALVLGTLQAGLAGPEAARQALRAGVAMDVWDMSSMVRAHRSGRLGTGGLIFNLMGGVAYAGLGVLAVSEG